jgi:hypothetical protein
MSIEFVSFPVPADRVPDVAVFLYGSSEAMPQAREEPPEPEVPMSIEQRHELLTRIYKESEPTFRRLVMLAAEREDPTRRVSFEQVTQDMGWPTPRSLPGTLGAFGRRTNHRYGGYWPFHRDLDHAEWSWFVSMDADVADFLLELHAMLQLPLHHED